MACEYMFSDCFLKRAKIGRVQPFTVVHGCDDVFRCFLK